MFWALSQTQMTDFPALLYTSTSKISTLSYTWSLKKISLSDGASPHRPLWGVPPSSPRPRRAAFSKLKMCCYLISNQRIFFVSIQGSKLKNEGINNEKSHGIALEPHHVWEYPCRALTQDSTIMTFDFTRSVPAEKIKTEGDIKILR